MKFKNVFLPTLLFAFALTSCSTSSSGQARALLEDENNVVEIGDSIDVETRVLEHNGQTKPVSGQIIFPDGSSKSGRSFNVTMAGVYKVIYSAVFGTEEVTQTIYYHCYRTSASFFLSSDASMKAVNGEYSHNTKTTTIQGAKLTLTQNLTYTYDGFIDFNTYNKNNPFIELVVDTSEQGEADLETLTVRLTDVDDPSNYVEMNIRDSGPTDDDGQGSYILAGANGQFKTGYEGTRLHTGNYGTNTWSSFRALPTSSPGKPLKLYFDYPARTLYASPIIWSTDGKGKITDLDDPGIYKSTVWEGFKNGRATVSVFAKSLTNSSADVIVTGVANNDLTKLIFKDEIAPTINVNYDGQEPSALPQAKVGKPYQLFGAEVVDNFDRELTYTAYVTYKDQVNNKVKDISVVNNSFTPTKSGTYTIKYVARDYSDNVATKSIDVVAVNSITNLSISLDETTMSKTVFSEFNLPKVNEVNVSGGSGIPVVERRIVDASRKTIEIDGDVFVPTEPGEYTVYYTARDYIGNIATATLTITALETTKPIFVGDLNLPAVLIKGHSYTLPSYQAVETVNGKTVYLNLSVSVNGVSLTNGKFVASDTCNVRYSVTGSTGSGEHLITIPVVDSEESSKQDVYFYGNFDVEEKYDEVTLSSSHDASAIFASVLPYDNPIISFVKNEGLSNFGHIEFKFYESTNPSKSLTFKVRFVGENAFVSLLSGGDEYPLSNEIRNEKKFYTLNFDSTARTLKDINHKELTKINVDDHRNPFTGFSDGLYLEISMVDVTSASSISMVSLCNQDFGNVGYYLDIASPIIIFQDAFKNEQEYGVDAVIPAVKVFDVLSEASATVTVKAPDGSFKVRNEDATIPHTFKLDSFGSYVVTYKALDSAGNASSYPRKITVFDNVPPSLTVNYNLSDTYKLNSEITIPSYSASDNLDQYALSVYLTLPNDEHRLLLTDNSGTVTSYLGKDNPIYNASFKVNNNTFRVEQTGRYLLRYVVYDDAFNKVVKEYSFTVK